MIEVARLQLGARDRDIGNSGLRQNLGGNVLDRRISDFVDEADILVLAGHDARNDFAPGDFGVDDGLAPAPSIVDHHDEILHAAALFAAPCDEQGLPNHRPLFLKNGNMSTANSEKQKFACGAGRNLA